MLQAAQDNYISIAEKVGETAAYPGNWLYESWSESELKYASYQLLHNHIRNLTNRITRRWLDERGIPAPQSTTRDKLIAQVRRNSRLASLKLNEAQASTSKSAEAAKQSITDAIFNSWSDSELKNWCDANGIRVPQGSTRNELLALARRNRAYLSDDTLLASINAYYRSATNTVASTYSKATDTVSDQVSKISQAAFDKAIQAWSDSRLKEYLDSRGVPVPQNGKRDEFLAKVRMYRHKAANSYGAWEFEFWTYDDLKKLVEEGKKKFGDKASSATSATRQELVHRARELYSQAKSTEGSSYASINSAMAKVTDSAKQQTFDSWSDSDLKAYLDSYGISTYQGSPRNELIANARRAQHMFQYGISSPTESIYQRVKNGMCWLYSRFMTTLGCASEVTNSARESMQYVYDRGAEKSEESGHRAEEKARYAYDRAYEEGQKGYHRAKEEL